MQAILASIVPCATRRFLKAVLSLITTVATLMTPQVNAQSSAAGFPSKPVTIVVPFASGGSPDQLARLLATHLGKRWGTPVVVENRPGAGGNIAANAVARAVPDGHTLLMGTDGPLAINPSLYAAMPYDPSTDFAPIGLAATVDFVLVAAPQLAITTVQQFVELAAKQEPPMAYGSSGVGSQHHLGMEVFGKRLGITLRHVPYRGVAPALADVMGNHIPVMFAAIPSAAQLVQSGKVRALAVTGQQRSSMIPDVPTLRESGYPDYELKAWFGLVAPAKTPTELVKRLNGDLNDTLALPEVLASLHANGFTARRGSPEEFADLIASEQRRWAVAAKAADVTAQ